MVFWLALGVADSVVEIPRPTGALEGAVGLLSPSACAQHLNVFRIAVDDRSSLVVKPIYGAP